MASTGTKGKNKKKRWMEDGESRSKKNPGMVNRGAYGDPVESYRKVPCRAWTPIDPKNITSST